MWTGLGKAILSAFLRLITPDLRFPLLGSSVRCLRFSQSGRAAKLPLRVESAGQCFSQGLAEPFAAMSAVVRVRVSRRLCYCWGLGSRRMNSPNPETRAAMRMPSSSIRAPSRLSAARDSSAAARKSSANRSIRCSCDSASCSIRCSCDSAMRASWLMNTAVSALQGGELLDLLVGFGLGARECFQAFVYGHTGGSLFRVSHTLLVRLSHPLRLGLDEGIISIFLMINSRETL